MIVQPNLTTHPKFLMFKRELGTADALEYLLRLWGHCQVMQRGGEWGAVNADYVEAVCIWSGLKGKLFEALCAPFCGKPGWVKVNAHGKVTIVGWNEHNLKLVSDWHNGRKGGRPKKAKGSNPSETHGLTQGAKGKTHRKPMGTPIGLDRIGEDGSGVPERARGSGEADFPEAEIPSLEAVLAYCGVTTPTRGVIPEETGRAFWEHFERSRYPRWTDKNGNHFQWRGRLDTWHRGDVEKNRPGQKTGPVEKTREQLEALLEAETDPGRRAELKAEIKKTAV